jgi:hypothetical protein
LLLSGDQDSAIDGNGYKEFPTSFRKHFTPSSSLQFKIYNLQWNLERCKSSNKYESLH